MTDPFVESAPMIVTNVALIRVAWVVLGHLRTFLNRHRRVRWRLSTIELVTLPEPLILATMAVRSGSFASRPGVSGLVAIPAVAASVAGLAVSLWAFASFPQIGTGHYIDSGQRIVSRGIYRWIRHPIYLGVFLVWIGFALGCQSLAAGTAIAVYVLPAYLLYIRAEEEMMSSHFGDEYARYCERAGALLPRLGHA
jgi:protein-S-isoprenylcysteine O-methyltransferase Ste14